MDAKERFAAALACWRAQFPDRTLDLITAPQWKAIEERIPVGATVLAIGGDFIHWLLMASPRVYQHYAFLPANESVVVACEPKTVVLASGINELRGQFLFVGSHIEPTEADIVLWTERWETIVFHSPPAVKAAKRATRAAGLHLTVYENGLVLGQKGGTPKPSPAPIIESRMEDDRRTAAEIVESIPENRRAKCEFLGQTIERPRQCPMCYVHKCELLQLNVTRKDHCKTCAHYLREGSDIPADAVNMGVLTARVPSPAVRHGAKVCCWAVGVVPNDEVPPGQGRAIETLERAGWDEAWAFVSPNNGAPVGAHPERTSVSEDANMYPWDEFLWVLRELKETQEGVGAYMLVNESTVFEEGDLRGYLEELCLWPTAEPGNALALTGHGSHHGWRPFRSWEEPFKAIVMDWTTVTHLLHWAEHETAMPDIDGMLALFFQDWPIWQPSKAFVR